MGEESSPEKMPATNEPPAVAGSHSHSMFLRPPEFLKDKSQFKQYKIEVQRWQRVTSVAKKDQGDVIMMSIPPGQTKAKFRTGVWHSCGEQ